MEEDNSNSVSKSSDGDDNDNNEDDNDDDSFHTDSYSNSSLDERLKSEFRQLHIKVQDLEEKVVELEQQ